MTAKKLLLIDGDAASRMFLDVNLSKFGFAVTSVATTEEALVAANQERPDLLICDANSQTMKGIEFCWMIRETDNLKGIPFILLSSDPNSETEISAYRSGVDAIVYRPVSIRALITRIETLLVRLEQILDDSEPLHVGEETDSNKPELQGSLSAFSLIELIQFLHMGKKSGTLRIHHEGEFGEMRFLEGEVTFASAKQLAGEEAVYRMASWESGRFSWQSGSIASERNIQKPTMKLILDCCSVLDMENIIVQQNS